MDSRIDRRELFRRALGLTGIAVAGSFIGRDALAAAQDPTSSPYGSIDGQSPDQHQILLPAGFTARVVARSGRRVGSSSYRWPIFPDGAATFPAGDGGWYYTVNSESPSIAGGGVSAIRFGADGEIADAYRILVGTNLNCAGGPTPWGTWLSCEEYEGGQVWECDPTQESQGEVRPAMGTFQHEAVAVDADRQMLYLTEDQADGLLYRFVPDAYPDLGAGVLQAASVGDDGAVSWFDVTDPTSTDPATRYQVPEATPFAGGEGIWYHDGAVFFTTKGDHRVWELDVVADRLRVVWTGVPGDPVAGTLTNVDNITVASTGDLFVAEDGGNLELVLLTPDGDAFPFLRLTDPADADSEITGPVFSPDGTRLYFSSQRGTDGGGLPIGTTYEITGPFLGAQPQRAAAEWVETGETQPADTGDAPLADTGDTQPADAGDATTTTTNGSTDAELTLPGAADAESALPGTGDAEPTSPDAADAATTPLAAPSATLEAVATKSGSTAQTASSPSGPDEPGRASVDTRIAATGAGVVVATAAVGAVIARRNARHDQPPRRRAEDPPRS